MPPKDSGDPGLDWKTYGLALGARVKHLRELRGWTQEHLAERVGLHRNQISNIERNVSRDGRPADPVLSTIYRLALAFGVAPKVLLPDSDHLVAEVSAEAADIGRPDVQIEVEQAVQNSPPPFPAPSRFR